MPDQVPTYLVPKETKRLVEANIAACQNLRLILARYVPGEVIYNDNYDERGRQKWQDVWLRQEVLPRFDVTKIKPLADAVYARWRAMTAGASAFTMRSQGRLLVGLGGKGVMEIGITLSHVTGLPYIPGSALKGLTRAYALFSIAAALGIPTTEVEPLAALDTVLADAILVDPFLTKKDKMTAKEKEERIKKLQKDKVLDIVGERLKKGTSEVIPFLQGRKDTRLYNIAFGSQDNGGVCVFHDAVVADLPRSGSLFKADVMTPHFKDYYDDVNSDRPRYGKGPDDGQNPNPILFITVAERTQFAFAVGLRRTAEKSDYQDIRDDNGQALETLSTAHTQAVKWLQAALFELGIGAKTAAGYGVFVDPKPING